MNARFLLAKYAPDLARMEPRNIGVILWSRGKLCARFLEASEATFVAEQETYERWIEFWTTMINGDEIRPTRGRPVSTSDPECLDALAKTQKGNYLLVQSGELLHRIKGRELQAAANYLFNDLVATKYAKQRKRMPSFVSQCDKLLNSVGIAFKPRESIPCTWHGVSRKLHPDYYIGNGHPEAILQRVKLSKEESVNSSAHLLDILLDQGIIERASCRVLVRSRDMTTRSAEQSRTLFERMCGIVDIDGSTAKNELAALRSSLSDEFTVPEATSANP